MARCIESSVATVKLARSTHVRFSRSPLAVHRFSSLPSRVQQGYHSNQVFTCATYVAEAGAPTKTGREQDTLFKRLGGGPAVRAAVDLFYDKMMADPRVNYFFEGIDMKKQRAHQAAFLTYAMGGSKQYEGNANMTSAHSRLARDMDMRMEHFDIVLDHLGGALRDLQVSEAEVAEAAALVETLRPAFQEAIKDAKK
ncbi:g10683 [Coccomyxa elongata]